MHSTSIKIALAIVSILAATALVAQNAELTPEQQAAKCAAEGGCALFTYQEFMSVLQAEKAISYKQGLRACNSNI